MENKKRISVTISRKTHDKMHEHIPLALRNTLVDALLSLAADKAKSIDPYILVGALNSGQFQIVAILEPENETD